MGDSSASPAEMGDRKPSWPQLSLAVSVLLWLLAWEMIVWFVPVQPLVQSDIVTHLPSAAKNPINYNWLR
jgi:hypothetical protein